MREQKFIKKITMFAASVVAACMILLAAPTVAEAAGMTVTQVGQTANSITISWTPVAGASYYLVPTATGGSQVVYTTSHTITGLTESSKYYVSVYAYPANAEDQYDYIAYDYSVPVATAPKVTTIYLDKWQPGTGSPTLAWDYFKNSTERMAFDIPDGYDIEVIDNKGKKVLNKSVNYLARISWSFNSSKVKNKGFSIRIKPYFTIGVNNQKIEGNWTAWKTIVPQPKVSGNYKTNYSARTKKVNLKWKKVTGAKSYTIYRKTGTSSSGKFKKIKTVKGTSFSQSVNYLKSYQYYVVANKVPMKVKGKTKKYNSYVKDSYYRSIVY